MIEICSLSDFTLIRSDFIPGVSHKRMVFYGGSVVKNMPASAGYTETWIPSLGQKNRLEKRKWLPTPVLFT